MNNEFIKVDQTADFPNRGARRYWVVAAGLVCLAVLVSRFDIQVAGFNRFGDIPGDLRRIFRLSEFFAHGFGVAVVGCGIWCLASHKRQYIPRIMICAVWPGIVASCLKLFVSRTRPGKLIPQFPESSQETFNGFWAGMGSEFNSVYDFQSFPSAHTATAIGLAIGLTWAFPRGRYLFWTLASLAAIQRITAGAHWLSDVVAGVAIAVLCAGAVTQNWGIGYWLGLWEKRGIQRLLNQGIISRVETTSSEANTDPSLSAKVVSDDDEKSEHDVRNAA